MNPLSTKNIGTVVQVIGPVARHPLPGRSSCRNLNRTPITLEHNGKRTITAEVAQQIGDGVVRCVAMSSTDGLVRGTEAVDTGSPITVPVGEACLGRIFNLLGEPAGRSAGMRRESSNAAYPPRGPVL